MKKIILGVSIGILSAVIMGTAVSTLGRYTGINLYSSFSTGVTTFAICLIACSGKKKKKAN